MKRTQDLRSTKLFIAVIRCAGGGRSGGCPWDCRMSKVYFFMKDIDTSHLGKTILPDVYCPVGGYDDKNMNRRFDSKGEKFRYLKSHGMREAEIVNPNKGIGGTEGCSIKQRGSRGNFRARPMPSWMRKELAKVQPGGSDGTRH